MAKGGKLLDKFLSVDMTARSDQHLDWIDVAKGVAIVLVVFGHTWRGLYKSDIIPPPLFAAVDARIYAFHMPVFFALAGWFFIPSLTKTSLGTFAKRRIVRLLWPIVLWTYLFLAIKLLAGGHANNPAALADLFILPIPGKLHLWFLWALLMMSFAFFLLKPFSAAGRTPAPVLLVAGIAVIAGYYWRPHYIIHDWFGEALEFAPFMFLGMVLAQYGLLSGRLARSRGAALAVFALILGFWPQVASSGFGFPAKLVLVYCFLVMLSAAQSSAQTRLVKGFRVLGGGLDGNLPDAHHLFRRVARISVCRQHQ